MSDNAIAELRGVIETLETDMEETQVLIQKLVKSDDIAYWKGHIDGIDSALDELYYVLEILEVGHP